VFCVIATVSWSVAEEGWGQGGFPEGAGQHCSSRAGEDLLLGAILAISALGSFIQAFDFTGQYRTRTPSVQGGFQAAGIMVSLLMAFAGGALVGKQEASAERRGLAATGAPTYPCLRLDVAFPLARRELRPRASSHPWDARQGTRGSQAGSRLGGFGGKGDPH